MPPIPRAAPASHATRAARGKSSRNRLLDALPPADRIRLRVAGKTVELAFAEVLHTPGANIRHVYFPLDGYISNRTAIDGPGTLELGLIGNEGMCGIALVLGVNTSAHFAVVQGEGTALRIGAAAFRSELKRSRALRRLLNRYASVLLTQLAQTASCLSSHRIEQRLARLLLMSRDRAQSGTFSITHARLADMLGVRRVGVTEAAGALKRKHLIHYARSQIEILDRLGLERTACGCYAINRHTYRQLLG